VWIFIQNYSVNRNDNCKILFLSTLMVLNNYGHTSKKLRNS